MTAPDVEVEQTVRDFYALWAATPRRSRLRCVWHVNEGLLTRMLADRRHNPYGLTVDDNPLLLFGRPVHVEADLEGVHFIPEDDYADHANAS